MRENHFISVLVSRSAAEARFEEMVSHPAACKTESANAVSAAIYSLAVGQPASRSVTDA
jgi:hypothetical protein